jgi:hypothetical protein
MPNESAMMVARVRMWEKGHTFDEIDGMNLDDFGGVLGYWNETARLEAKKRRMEERAKRRANRGKRR